MELKNSFILGLVLAFWFPFSSPSTLHAQQGNDDPNWRERWRENALKKLEKLREEHDQLMRERQIFFTQKENEKRLLDFGYWDLFPPGHPYGRRVDSGVIILSPSSLRGKPFKILKWDLNL